MFEKEMARGVRSRNGETLHANEQQELLNIYERLTIKYGARGLPSVYEEK